MKLVHFLLGVLLVLSCLTVANGDSLTPTDPKIVPRSPGSPGEGGPQPAIIGADLTILFTCPSGDCGDDSLARLPPDGSEDTFCQVGGVDIFQCDFINESGINLYNLSLTINPGGGLVSCDPAFGFAQCVVIQEGAPTTPTSLFFSGGNGIHDGKGFGFTLEDWAPNTQVVGTFNTPEPSTWVLSLTAIAIMGVLSVRRRALPHR